MCENCLLDLEWLASVFCYNYSSLKEDVHVSTAASSRKFEVVLCEHNAGCTAASAQLNHCELFSLNQSNCSYNAQLSVS